MKAIDLSLRESAQIYKHIQFYIVFIGLDVLKHNLIQQMKKF